MKKLKIKKQNEVTGKKGVDRVNKRIGYSDAVSYLYFDEGFQMLFPGSFYFKPAYYSRKLKVKS